MSPSRLPASPALSPSCPRAGRSQRVRCESCGTNGAESQQLIPAESIQGRGKPCWQPRSICRSQQWGSPLTPPRARPDATHDIFLAQSPSAAAASRHRATAQPGQCHPSRGQWGPSLATARELGTGRSFAKRCCLAGTQGLLAVKPKLSEWKGPNSLSRFCCN